MTARVASGMEQAVFGWTDAQQIDDWLDRHVTERLGSGVDRVLFRAGRVGAVYGLRLRDGSDVVVKVPRGDPPLGPLRAAVDCQRHLAEAGYPCPSPMDTPAVTEGRVGLIEELLDVGEVGDIRQARVRRAAVASLADQVSLLAELTTVAGELTEPPAWARCREGPWPIPHDSIFDFTRTPDGYGWLDQVAADAAHRAATATCPTVIGHSDWYVGNLRFTDDAVVAAYDWDSLIADTEPVIAGFAAASHTAGNTTGPSTATPDEIATFLTEYAEHRPHAFTATGRSAAIAAAVWVMTYNARCELCFIPAGDAPSPDSNLSALTRDADSYLTLRW